MPGEHTKQVSTGSAGIESPLTTPIRPVWLASYPRSGNTFLRIILEKIFGLQTYSLYRVEGQQAYDPSAEALEEAPFLSRHWRHLVQNAPQARLTPIKTHDLPEDSLPAIYIVRDGRAAIDSYFHYHQKFAFEQPSLTEIIAGACQFGSWSSHYYGWKPTTRAQTLLLRYEELVAKPTEAIAAISKFLDLPASDQCLPGFDELKARFPAFFRRGRNEDFLSQWTPPQLEFFNRLHGEAMRDLGYSLSQGTGTCADLAPELANSAERLHKKYLAELSKQGDFLAARHALTAQLERVTTELSQVRRNRWVRVGMKLKLLKPGAPPPPSSVPQLSPPPAPAA